MLRVTCEKCGERVTRRKGSNQNYEAVDTMRVVDSSCRSN